MQVEMMRRVDVDRELRQMRREVKKSFTRDPDLPFVAWMFDGQVLVTVNGERAGDPVSYGSRPTRAETMDFLREAVREAPAGACVEVLWDECARVREAPSLQTARDYEYEPFDWVSVVLGRTPPRVYA